jgi:predicted lipoprotein with Yx(FWY)xxD motif
MSLPSTTIRRGLVPGVVLALGLVACASPADEGSPSAPASASEPAAATPEPMTESPSASAASEEPSAAAGDATVLVADSDLGQILTDAEGMVIYYFANDTEGTSNCEGDCLANWPPVPVDGEPTAGDGVDAELGTITGNDDSTQLTVNGFPAYYFAGDQAAGDTNGQAVGDVWWVFGPDGEPIEE